MSHYHYRTNRLLPKIANEFSRKVKTIQFEVMFVVSSVDSVDAAHGLTV